MQKTPLYVKNPIFYNAVQHLGGTNKAALALGIAPSLVVHYVRRCKNPIDINLCARVEKATKGKFTWIDLRPDIKALLKKSGIKI